MAENRSSPEYARRNAAQWDKWAPDYAAAGRAAWSTDEMSWGIWKLPESDLHVVPEVDGADVVELGCGTAYWSAWLARRGAAPVGIDISWGQLCAAGALQDEFGPRFPLIRASAAAVPLSDRRFDLVFSEYGASIWVDPYEWIPEAARLLRPGGTLLFLRNSTLLMMCTPLDGSATTTTLHRDQFGMHRFEWPDEDDDSVEFHLAHGEWIRLLRRHGFEVEDLIELQAPEGASTTYDYVTPDWARRWPSEEIWKARLAGP